MPDTDMATARNRVTAVPFATPGVAVAHYRRLLELETDCRDVHDALALGNPGFILLDVRSPETFRAAHIPGAINLPYGKITHRSLLAFQEGLPFVVYCNGPHCNGADRAALALALHGRPVKKMIGGVHGWRVSGFALSEPQPA